MNKFFKRDSNMMRKHADTLDDFIKPDLFNFDLNMSGNMFNTGMEWLRDNGPGLLESLYSKIRQATGRVGQHVRPVVNRAVNRTGGFIRRVKNLPTFNRTK